MPLTITVPANCPGYLPGARLLGVLAYPPSSPSDQRWRKAELALCRSVLLAQQQVDPAWATQEQLIIPEHMSLSAVDLEKELEKIEELIRHRMGAAHVAIRYFRHAQRIASGGAPSKRGTPTIDARIQQTIEQEAEREDWLTGLGMSFKPRFPKNGDNFEHRVFRRSLPVLPIAVAVAVAIHQSQKALRTQPSEVQDGYYRDRGGPQINVADFLTNPALAQCVIAGAEQYEQLIPHLPKLRIPHIVKLRLE